MKIKSIIPFSLFCIICVHSGVAQTKTISKSDLKIFRGNWYGSLTYLDYISKKPYTMPADLRVRLLGKHTLIFLNTYPNEPKANSSDTINISTDGAMLNKEVVKSKQMLDNGSKENY